MNIIFQSKDRDRILLRSTPLTDSYIHHKIKSVTANFPKPINVRGPLSHLFVLSTNRIIQTLFSGIPAGFVLTLGKGEVDNQNWENVMEFLHVFLSMFFFTMKSLKFGGCSWGFVGWYPHRGICRNHCWFPHPLLQDYLWNAQYEQVFWYIR